MDEIEKKVKASTRVVDIIRDSPELADYFLELGICGCGYAWESNYYWTMDKVAKEKGIDLDSLLHEVNIRLGRP